MNGKMEFLPILQDHVPSQGRCPKTTAFKQFQSMHCQKPCYSILQIINLENILYFTFVYEINVCSSQFLKNLKTVCHDETIAT